MSSLCEVPNQPEMVNSLLTVLGNRDQNDVSRRLLRMSTSQDTCAAMRSSGCLPLLIRLLYAPDSSEDMKKHVALALHNIVNANPSEEQSRSEGRILSLLENVRDYCNVVVNENPIVTYGTEFAKRDKNVGLTVATLLRLSFDSEQRRAMCQLGGLHAIAHLLQVIQEVYGGSEESIHCLMLKRYAGMTLTNLTYGESTNKSLLCSLKQFMHALVAQLNCCSEELQQATASVIRNLSWRPDDTSKQILRETGAVSVLMKTAMKVKKESTLETLLSALWNLSSHCNLNKVEICAVDGALKFLVLSLTYKAPSQKSTVTEFAGCVLRNVSSHIAEREDYRVILREQDCLQVLTGNLTCSNPTIVGNACITLWNLTGDCPEDQYTLWMLGAPNLLRNLVHSKHKLIALGSAAALKNLLATKPESFYLELPADGLAGEAKRRSRTIEDELDEVLSETRVRKEAHVPSAAVAARRDDKFVFSLTEVEKKNQRLHHRTFHKTHPHMISRSRSKERSSMSLQDGANDNINRTDVPDKKAGSNIDKLLLSDFSKQNDGAKTWIETKSSTKQSNKLWKSEYSAMKDGSYSDLRYENDAISTVDELLEVVKDMASLRINEDNTQADVADKSKLELVSGVATCEDKVIVSEHDLSAHLGSVESEQICRDSAIASTRQEPVQSESVREHEVGESDVVVSRDDLSSTHLDSVESKPTAGQEDQPYHQESENDVITSRRGRLRRRNSVESQLIPEDENCNNELRNGVVAVTEDDQSSTDHHLDIVQSEYVLNDVAGLNERRNDTVIMPRYDRPSRVESVHSMSVNTDEVCNDEFKNCVIESQETVSAFVESVEPENDAVTELSKHKEEPDTVNIKVEGDAEWIDISDASCVDGHLVKSVSRQKQKDIPLVEIAVDGNVKDVEEKEPTLRAVTEKEPPASSEDLQGSFEELSEETVRPIVSEKQSSAAYVHRKRSVEDLSYPDFTAGKDSESLDSHEQVFDDLLKKGSSLSPDGLDRSLEELCDVEKLKEETLVFNSDYAFEDTDEESTDYAIEYSPGEKCDGTTSEDALNEVQPERTTSSPEVYGDYAETDLDQPTDYSLQYGEEDELTDEDDLHPSDKRDPAGFYVTAVPISVHEDTVKTYCTEGTPFETPYNFSTATSMSDLRAEPSIKEEVHTTGSEAACVNAGTVKAEADLENGERLRLDSGLLSPAEKPVQFCEEGTPGQCLSRFSSLSSLCGDQPKGSVSPSVSGGERSSRPNSDKFISTRNSESIGTESIQSGIKVVRPSVFEEIVVSFKEESTPVNFSCATSLSSLSFDDEPRILMDASLKRESAAQKNSTQTVGSATSRSVDGSGNDQRSEDVLSAGSRFIGLQPRGREVLPAKSSMQGPSGLKTSVPQGGTCRTIIKQENGQLLPTASASNGEDPGACDDSTYHFCTEGTPASISHAGSHSDLLMLSGAHHREDKFQSVCDKNSAIDESSDDNLSFSDDCENILAECIKSGMPRTSAASSEKGFEINRMNDIQNETPESDVDATNACAFEKAHGDDDCQQEDNDKHDEVEDKGKVVTFDNADHYAEETPLMFSRTSSLASLSSFDQQSIVDDRSSVISDFSRLTSGAVSPSEIPDSPSQLVSASPNRSKPPDFSVVDGANVKTSFAGLPQTSSAQSCVFEDDVKPFKVEDTPVEFSRATSLSSLSICDDANACLAKEETGKCSSPKAELDGTKDKSEERNSIILESEGEEDDDEILAACISIGMQETRKNPVANAQIYNGYEGLNHFSSHLRQPSHPGLQSAKPGTNLCGKSKLQTSSAVKMPNRDAEPTQTQAGGAFDDVTHRYCTEDTPANISHAGSHSDLSVLSFRSGKDEALGGDTGAGTGTGTGRTRTVTELSDDLFSVSDNEGMLAECIQAGMPKKSSSRRRNNSLTLHPDKEASGSCSPRAHFRDDRNAHESFHDRSRSSAPSHRVSPVPVPLPVTSKFKMMSRPLPSACGGYWGCRSYSYSRKPRKGTFAMPMESRHVEVNGAFEDSTHRFCTEDTPASISHAGSNSDISVLSIPDDDREEHHELPRRRGSIHNLSPDDSRDNSDTENILAECIQSGMPKVKPLVKPPSKSAHAFATNPAEQSRRPNPPHSPAPLPMRLGSKMTARITKNMGFMRWVFSQVERPQVVPAAGNHPPVVPQHFFGEGIGNRHVAVTGTSATWQTCPPQNLCCVRTPPYYPNNSHIYDAGWEMDASILKDSQALRSMLQNQQNPRAWRKSPSNRRKDMGSSLLQVNLAPLKSGMQPLNNPNSLPPNIRPLDRQRTFTKLEPSVHVHLASPTSTTRIPIPAQSPSKLVHVDKPSSNSKKTNPDLVAKARLKSKPSCQVKKLPDQNKPAELSRVSKSPSGYMSCTSRTSGSWPGKSNAAPTNSSSSVFKHNTAERRSFKLPSRSTGLEDRRSNSFSSIASSASSKSSVKPFKREITSKIASLWKKANTSSDDSQSRPKSSGVDSRVDSRVDSHSNDSKRTSATRQMVRSATFEGLPRNLELAKAHKIKDDSQIRSGNSSSAQGDRSTRKTAHKNRIGSEQINKAKAKAQVENVETSRNDAGTSVIERRSRVQSQKSSCVKSDQHSVRVTKV